MRRVAIAWACIAAAALAQTIDVAPSRAPARDGANNTVGLSVTLEQRGGSGAVTVVAKGAGKLPDGCTVEGFLKHKVNDSPLSPTQATLAGGAFEMSFGPFPGLYPGLYEVEVAFYPEHEAVEVQEALAKEVGDAAWRFPSVARATLVIGGERDPKRQAAEEEKASFAALSKVARRVAEIDRSVQKGHQEGEVGEASWIDACRVDLARISEEAQKGSELYGNPFATERTHRMVVCHEVSEWMEEEVAFLTKGKLPRGVEGETKEEKQESASAVFLALREKAYGALAAAKGSARVVDACAEDVLADVSVAREAREAMTKALALEKKGPPNPTRYREAVAACRKAIGAVAGRNAAAVSIYASRSVLADEEERFRETREALGKALEGALASADAHEGATGTWQLSEEARKADADVERALAGIESRLK